MKAKQLSIYPKGTVKGTNRVATAWPILGLLCVLAWCNPGALCAEPNTPVPLGEFAILGEQDTPEKAGARQFAFPADGPGLWIGSIPRGAKVYVALAHLK